MVFELLLALFAVIGLAACLRRIAGALLYPVQGALLFLPGRGDGGDLEHRLKGVRALCADGKLQNAAIFLADLGLDETGLATAQALCRRYPQVRFCLLEQTDSAVFREASLGLEPLRQAARQTSETNTQREKKEETEWPLSRKSKH
jgi:hypothetical protein